MIEKCVCVYVPDDELSIEHIDTLFVTHLSVCQLHFQLPNQCNRSRGCIYAYCCFNQTLEVDERGNEMKLELDRLVPHFPSLPTFPFSYCMQSKPIYNWNRFKSFNVGNISIFKYIECKDMSISLQMLSRVLCPTITHLPVFFWCH